MRELTDRVLDDVTAEGQPVIEPGRPIRILGLRADMVMPDDARHRNTPTHGGW